MRDRQTDTHRETSSFCKGLLVTVMFFFSLSLSLIFPHTNLFTRVQKNLLSIIKKYIYTYKQIELSKPHPADKSTRMLTYSYLCHNLRTSYVIYAQNSKLTFQNTMEKGLLRMMIILMIMLLCCHSKCGKIYLISMIDFLLRMLLFAKVCY